MTMVNSGLKRFSIFFIAVKCLANVIITSVEIQKTCMFFSDIGQIYYFNSTTKESLWEKPKGTDMAQVRCSHLLVKHRESRRPASWRQDNITCSKEEALATLKG